MKRNEKECVPLLKQVWAKVRSKHLFPELPEPVISESMDRVALETKSKHITLSQSFIDEAAKQLPQEKVLEALLDHGVAHYTYCPWDFHTHLTLYQEAKKVLKDKEMAQKSTDYFMDVVADTHCYRDKDTPISDLYRHMERSALDEAMHALYQKIWAEDLNVQGYEEISRKLSRIPYLKRKPWPESIRRFSKVIRGLLESQRSSGILNQPNPMGDNDLGRYTSEELDQGLKEFALSSGDPGEFKAVVKDFEEELKEAGFSSHGTMGLGPGSSLDADTLFYIKLSENFSLPIKRKPIEKSGSLYPLGHSPWELGKPIRDIDPWTSFGKVMPGITQVWERTEGETFGEEEGTPNCIVIIDSSGSMTNPREHLSYAVLGAACAADSYLRNDAAVAVYNFSDAKHGGRQLLEYTRERKRIYQSICHYFGGGTRLDIEELDSLQDATQPDIFMITDMQITNLETLIGYLNKLENRVTAVHIGDNKHVAQFRRSMDLRKNVSIYSVHKKQDIPKIVLGRIREYFGSVS
ncbi:MAG: VWA domain-containing protein [Deltaproteobacteria bacterium]|nr:MAG: VWA domain-containing protein [Deltaproteobacteria bacterium]